MKMREVAIGILFLFITLAIVGGVNMYRQQRTPAALEVRVLGNSYISRSADELWYVCGASRAAPSTLGDPAEELRRELGLDLDRESTIDGFAYGWNIEENHPITTETAEEQLEAFIARAEPAPIDIVETLYALAGGLTGGLAAKDIPRVLMRAQKTGRKGYLEILVVSAAVVSGYALGSFVVKHIFPPRCDAEEVVAILKQKTTWRTLERQMWLAKYGEIREILAKIEVQVGTQQIAQAEGEKLLQLKALHKTIEVKVENETYDFAASDFLQLAHMARQANEIDRNIYQQPLD